MPPCDSWWAHSPLTPQMGTSVLGQVTAFVRSVLKSRERQGASRSACQATPCPPVSHRKEERNGWGQIWRAWLPLLTPRLEHTTYWISWEPGFCNRDIGQGVGGKPWLNLFYSGKWLNHYSFICFIKNIYKDFSGDCGTFSKDQAMGSKFILWWWKQVSVIGYLGDKKDGELCWRFS